MPSVAELLDALPDEASPASEAPPPELRELYERLANRSIPIGSFHR